VIALLVLALLLLPYVAGVRRVRRGWPAWRTAAFAAGAVALAASLWPALDAAADRRLAAHMGEHLLLGLLAPALLALGAPVRLALGALPAPGRRAVGRGLHHPVVRGLTRPAVATALVVAATVVVHLPGAVDAAERSAALHAVEHAALCWTGLLFWSVVLAADPVPSPPSPIARVACITAVMTAMAIIGAWYSSASAILVGAYAGEPHALADQARAGALMWLGGGAVMLPALLAVAGAAMLAEERRQRRREAVR
jgi:cytochrome c oxidase assembly factor CtaG